MAKRGLVDGCDDSCTVGDLEAARPARRWKKSDDNEEGLYQMMLELVSPTTDAVANLTAARPACTNIIAFLCRNNHLPQLKSRKPSCGSYAHVWDSPSVR